MSNYPQEIIDTLRNMVALQGEKIAQLQAQSDDMYTTATFYKEQWEAAEAKLAIYEAKE